MYMHIFIIHYTPLVERKRFILDQLLKHGITDYEFVEVYDRGHIPAELEQLFVPELGRAAVSLACKHLYVYQQIVDKYDAALILEDDAILCDNFMSLLSVYLNQLPSTYDAFFIGRGINLYVPEHERVTGKYVYLKSNEKEHWGVLGSSRCTESYIITKAASKKIVDTKLQNIELPIDFLLNELFRMYNMEVYWAEPSLVQQGTVCGIFESALR
jgi:GR25 family glycosyltransferase involved in LPS biosynthesis